MLLEYSSFVNEEYGAEPLLCQVSRTYSSLWVLTLPHFAHFTRTLSIHGLCNSKFGPSGSFDAASTISFLENNRICLPQSLQSHPFLQGKLIFGWILNIMESCA